MAKVDSRTQRLRDAARRGSGSEPVSLFRVDRPVMGGNRETPWMQRPWVLSQPEVRRAPLRKLLVIAIRVLSLDLSVGKIRFTSETIAARERSELARSATKKQNGATELASRYFGPARSIAAQLLVASLPRSKARVMNLLCVTDDEVVLLHVPDTYREKYFANAVDVGWRLDRKKLEWTRDIESKDVFPEIQYGFTDGSWMTLRTNSIQGLPSFTDVFPDTLTKKDPIPPSDNYPELESKD